MEWGSVEAVPDEEALAILNNPARRRRVLRSRACYRNKSKVPSKLVAKTRVVALGHLDPDLHRVSRDSPTPMSLGVHPPKHLHGRHQWPDGRRSNSVDLMGWRRQRGIHAGGLRKQ